MKNQDVLNEWACIDGDYYYFTQQGLRCTAQSKKNTSTFYLPGWGIEADESVGCLKMSCE